jgi:hypothetical protein
MREILSGVFHWTQMHPKIRFEVSSYYLADEGVLLDPLTPGEGADSIPGRPKHILLTNRHHYRDSGVLAKHFGCKVWCVEQGLHEFKSGEKVESFEFGETLGCGIEVVEIGAICPDECALFIPRHGGIVALADGVVRMTGPLDFVPEEYMGDDAGAVKDGLRAAYRRLLEREFDHMLLAHGEPWIGGAHAALREFVEG